VGKISISRCAMYRPFSFCQAKRSNTICR